jgi:hypothetical protein
VQLSSYVRDTLELLYDENALFTSTKQVQRYVNRARYQIALETQCVRVLISGQSPFGAASQAGSSIPGASVPGAQPDAFPNATQSTSLNSFQTITGVEKYPFSYGNMFAKQANSGVKGIVDIIDCAVSWGGIRPALNWMPWEDLQAFARSYNIGVFSYPFCWSTNGYGERGEVWLFPVPQIGPSTLVPGGQGEMEWDTTCVPLDLNTDNDPDAIPEPFQKFVPFYAAYWACMRAQRYGTAQIHWNYLNEHLNIGAAASDRGKTSNFYWASELP